VGVTCCPWCFVHVRFLRLCFTKLRDTVVPLNFHSSYRAVQKSFQVGWESFKFLKFPNSSLEYACYYVHFGGEIVTHSVVVVL
jgi:hypothetical protein